MFFFEKHPLNLICLIVLTTQLSAVIEVIIAVSIFEVIVAISIFEVIIAISITILMLIV